MAGQHTSNPKQIPELASAVIAVILRVAGPVMTEVRPYAIGTPERQVTARIGDALVYLTDRRLAGRIRQQWDASQYLATKRLPERVSQTWLAHTVDTYPVGVTVQLTGQVRVTARYLPAHRETQTPPHLRMQVDRLVWQVCDLQAWRAIGDAWFEAQRHLDR
jgi:hypothetical protein